MILKQKTSLKKIEYAISRLLKPFPDLPKAGRKWLANNIWWLVAIIVGLTAISVLTLISNMLNILVISPRSLENVSLPLFNNIWFFSLSTSLTLAVSIVSLVIFVTAIAPLKAGLKKGWDLLFLILVVNTIWMVFRSFLSFDIFNISIYILLGLFSSMVAAYFLFQIKSYFIRTK